DGRVGRTFPARALRKKEYVRVRGEFPARAPPSRTCREGFPRVRSAKKSTSTCGASYRHAHSHRARAEDVPRACAPQKRVRARAGRVTGTRAPIAHVRSELSARALHKKEYARVRGELPARAPPPCACGVSSPHAGGGIIYQKWVFFAISS